MLHLRLRPHVDKIILDQQFRYWSDCLHLSDTGEKMECNKTVYQLCMDFKIAYDLFRLEVLYVDTS
jgi:hypothetical protein